jgi:hypothetical protein
MFTNPALLIGLLAAVLPIIIHLLLRERPKPIHIPTVDFIRRAVERSKASRRIVNILLLLARILITVLVVLALTQPIWKDSPIREIGKGRVAAVVILDDAFYSGQQIDGRMQIEYSRDIAHAYLDKMAPGSKVACFTTRNYGRGLSMALSHVARDIDSATPRPGVGDLRAAIRAAGALLDGEAGELPRLIIAITDFNIATIRPAAGPLLAPDGCELRLLSIPERRGNGYIQSVSLHPRTRVAASQKLSVTCRIGGGALLTNTRVNLFLNGERAGTATVRDIDGVGNGVVQFQPALIEVGEVAGEVVLESGDGLAIDDSWYFTCEVRKPPRVLCIGNPGRDLQQRDIVGMALAPRGWYGRQRFEVDRRHYQNPLDEMNLQSYACVVLTGKCEFDSSSWIRLEQYVTDGGGLLIYPDKTTSLDALNGGALPLLPGAVELAALSDRAVTLRPAGTATSGSELLRQAGRGLSRVQFRQYYFCQPPDDTASIQAILNYGDNTLAIATRQIGRGQCAFVGIAVDPDWSDLLENDGFAPALHTLMQSLVRLDTAEGDIFCDAPISIEHPDPVPTGATVRLPDKGGVVQLAAADFHLGRAVYHNTAVPGHYRVDFGISGKSSIFAVNVFRSDRHYWFVPEAAQASLLAPGTTVQSAADPIILSSDMIAVDLPLMPFCLFAAFLFFLLEAYLGNYHLMRK